MEGMGGFNKGGCWIQVIAVLKADLIRGVGDTQGQYTPASVAVHLGLRR